MFGRCVVTILLVTMAGLFPQSLLAQRDNATEVKRMDNTVAASAPAGAAHSASGVIKKVDASRGTVMIEHGPIKSLNWPPMTMSFAVKDKKLLEKLAVDKKVDFQFVEQGDEYVVTAVK